MIKKIYIYTIYLFYEIYYLPLINKNTDGTKHFINYLIQSFILFKYIVSIDFFVD